MPLDPATRVNEVTLGTRRFSTQLSKIFTETAPFVFCHFILHLHFTQEGLTTLCDTFCQLEEHQMNPKCLMDVITLPVNAIVEKMSQHLIQLLETKQELRFKLIVMCRHVLLTEYLKVAALKSFDVDMEKQPKLANHLMKAQQWKEANPNVKCEHLTNAQVAVLQTFPFYFKQAEDFTTEEAESDAFVENTLQCLNKHKKCTNAKHPVFSKSNPFKFPASWKLSAFMSDTQSGQIVWSPPNGTFEKVIKKKKVKKLKRNFWLI